MRDLEMNENQKRILNAAIDRIIPSDDFPSASENGVDNFIASLLQTDRKKDAEMFLMGLDGLDAEAKIAAEASFADAAIAAQDAVLERVERGETQAKWTISSREFFAMLLNLTAEGYFSDPSNGANRNTVSWTMVGYDPGANRP